VTSINLNIKGHLKRNSTEKMGRMSGKLMDILRDLNQFVDFPAHLLPYRQCHPLTVLSLINIQRLWMSSLSMKVSNKLWVACLEQPCHSSSAH
jgi:hypothetical protein